MAGWTPFQFSSNKLQNANAISGVGAANSLNMFSNAAQTVLSWYEMWVNPSNVKMSYEFKQVVRHTVGSIATFHFRKDLTMLEVSGFAGWVAIQSNIEEMQSSVFSLMKGPASFKKSFTNAAKGATKSLKDGLDPRKRKGNSNRLNNSPRQFLNRLKSLADEPMYYIDSEGVEHYNIKYIKMFTKQYPTGVICEGYFKNFQIPESADDAQTIPYNFVFVVEDTKPVTILQRVAGMFSGAGSVAGSISGLF